MFGITDPEILGACKSFKKVRNDLIHEKAIEVNELTKSKLYSAQTEAKNAVSFVKRVTELLQQESE